MKYVNRIIAAPVLVLMISVIAAVMMLWLGLRKIHRRATAPINGLLNLLLVSFVAVLAFGTYRTQSRDYRTQYSLHGLAVVEKLRDLYPDMFEK